MTAALRYSTPWGLLGLIVFALVYVWFGSQGWPGLPDGCIAAGNCYCEAFSRTPVLVHQPSNTWSNLAAVVAGLALLVQADLDRRRRTPEANPMKTGGLYQTLYAGVVLFLGPG